MALPLVVIVIGGITGIVRIGGSFDQFVIGNHWIGWLFGTIGLVGNLLQKLVIGIIGQVGNIAEVDSLIDYY